MSVRRMTNFTFPFLVCWALLSDKGCLSVQVTSVDAPDVVTEGAEVTLWCRYDLANKPLYSMRWYFNETEFYKFDQTMKGEKTVYYIPGIDVDKDASDGEKLVLRNFTKESNGLYECEVTADVVFLYSRLGREVATNNGSSVFAESLTESDDASDSSAAPHIPLALTLLVAGCLSLYI